MKLNNKLSQIGLIIRGFFGRPSDPIWLDSYPTLWHNNLLAAFWACDQSGLEQDGKEFVRGASYEFASGEILYVEHAGIVFNSVQAVVFRCNHTWYITAWNVDKDVNAWDACEIRSDYSSAMLSLRSLSNELARINNWCEPYETDKHGCLISKVQNNKWLSETAYDRAKRFELAVYGKFDEARFLAEHYHAVREDDCPF